MCADTSPRSSEAEQKTFISQQDARLVAGYQRIPAGPQYCRNFSHVNGGLANLEAQGEHRYGVPLRPWKVGQRADKIVDEQLKIT